MVIMPVVKAVTPWVLLIEALQNRPLLSFVVLLSVKLCFLVGEASESLGVRSKGSSVSLKVTPGVPRELTIHTHTILLLL